MVDFGPRNCGDRPRPVGFDVTARSCRSQQVASIGSGFSTGRGGLLTMSGPAVGGVFISYRRQESSGITGRLYDRLAGRFGDDQVFMDVDTIALGVDFKIG